MQNETLPHISDPHDFQRIVLGTPVKAKYIHKHFRPLFFQTNHKLCVPGTFFSPQGSRGTLGTVTNLYRQPQTSGDIDSDTRGTQNAEHREWTGCFVMSPDRCISQGPAQSAELPRVRGQEAAWQLFPPPGTLSKVVGVPRG